MTQHVEDTMAEGAEPVPIFSKVVECARDTGNRVTAPDRIVPYDLAEACYRIERKGLVPKCLFCSPAFAKYLLSPGPEGINGSEQDGLVDIENRRIWGADIVEEARLPDDVVCLVSEDFLRSPDSRGVCVIQVPRKGCDPWPQP